MHTGISLTMERHELTETSNVSAFFRSSSLRDTFLAKTALNTDESLVVSSKRFACWGESCCGTCSAALTPVSEQSQAAIQYPFLGPITAKRSSTCKKERICKPWDDNTYNPNKSQQRRTELSSVHCKLKNCVVDYVHRPVSLEDVVDERDCCVWSCWAEDWGAGNCKFWGGSAGVEAWEGPWELVAKTNGGCCCGIEEIWFVIKVELCCCCCCCCWRIWIWACTDNQNLIS